MSRRTQQEAHRKMRAKQVPRETIYRYVYAEVVAWNDQHGNAHADKALRHATVITNQVYADVRTGITEHQRLERIHIAVTNYYSN